MKNKPIIGMIHLPPLVGYKEYPGKTAVLNKALRDMEILTQAGFDAVLVENDNDQPHQIRVSDELRGVFSWVVEKLVANAKIPVGLEIIYDMPATVEVGAAVGVSFVRLDVFVDDVETRWGKIFAQGKNLNSLRNKIKPDLLLLTDIQVKHARLLQNKAITESAMEAYKAGSNGVIITGDWTGVEPNCSDLLAVKKVLGDRLPVYIGSGLDSENVSTLWPLADGAIVGTSIKTGEEIDNVKANKLVKIIESMT
jgi:hypothetical protein